MKKLILVWVLIFFIAFTSVLINANITNTTNVTYVRSQKIIGAHRMPYTHKKRFYNHAQEHKTSNHVFDAVKIFWATKLNTVPYDPHNLLKNFIASPNFSLINNQNQKNNVCITLLGHATFLIQINNIAIITDPLFFDLSIFYKRSHQMPIKPEQLPKIDIIMLSHTHRDHMDKKSLLMLKKHDPLVFVPLGAKKWFIDHGFTKVYENHWWMQNICKISGSCDELKITFLPAIHWCQRFLGDTNKVLWGSWMIESTKGVIYFAGDSAYGKHFKEIHEFFPAIDIALMPVGPNEPRELMRHSHISAEEAGQAFLDLKARYFIPMHWGTFKLGTDSFYIPIERLSVWWKSHRQALFGKQLHVFKFGQTVIYNNLKLT